MLHHAMSVLNSFLLNKNFLVKKKYKERNNILHRRISQRVVFINILFSKKSHTDGEH